MFKVEYKYSACIKIVTDDIKILCDPWFGENAYYGTWQQFPPIRDKNDIIGDFDIIYISHIHPDHYCPETIRELFSKHGSKRIIIADWGSSPNYLAKKIASDGLSEKLLVANNLEIGNTRVRIIPNKTGSISDIDSALVVASDDSKKAVLNVNDCIYNDAFYSTINSVKLEMGVEFTLFCLGYTGAGPYPQTYYSPILQEKKLNELAEAKKQQFFERYLKAISKIDSVNRLPFAGKYILKGDLSILNQFRGVADALEVKAIDPGAVILDDGGEAFFDLETVTASSSRNHIYNNVDYMPSDSEYTWRVSVGFTPELSLLRRLLFKSIQNAHPKSECNQDCFWSIYVYDKPSKLIEIWSHQEPWNYMTPIATFNCNKNKNPMDTDNSPLCHSHVFIESKALFAVLTGITHWNNYEVGSVFQVRRVPDMYVEEMQRYLNFLSVI